MNLVQLDQFLFGLGILIVAMGVIGVLFGFLDNGSDDG